MVFENPLKLFDFWWNIEIIQLSDLELRNYAEGEVDTNLDWWFLVLVNDSWLV